MKPRQGNAGQSTISQRGKRACLAVDRLTQCLHGPENTFGGGGGDGDAVAADAEGIGFVVGPGSGYGVDYFAFDEKTGLRIDFRAELRQTCTPLFGPSRHLKPGGGESRLSVVEFDLLRHGQKRIVGKRWSCCGRGSYCQKRYDKTNFD